MQNEPSRNQYAGFYYLAGPINGKPGFNIDVFTAIADSLRLKGYNIITPFEVNALQHRREVSESDEQRVEYLRNDIRVLINCSGIIMLSGWATSKGATLEHSIAVALHLDRLYISDEGVIIRG